MAWPKHDFRHFWTKDLATIFLYREEVFFGGSHKFLYIHLSLRREVELVWEKYDRRKNRSGDNRMGRRRKKNDEKGGRGEEGELHIEERQKQVEK